MSIQKASGKITAPIKTGLIAEYKERFEKLSAEGSGYKLKAFKIALLIRMLSARIFYGILTKDKERAQFCTRAISALELKAPIKEIFFLLRYPLLIALSLLRLRRKAGQPKKILVIRLDRMGDFVLTLPLLQNIRLKYPEASVDILLRPYTRELALVSEAADQILLYKGFFGTIKEVRKERYDLVIDPLLGTGLKTSFLAYSSGASVTAGFKGRGRELLFSHSVEPKKGKSVLELTEDLQLALDIPAEIMFPAIKPETAPAKEFIGMHPGAFYPSQSWGAGNFAALAAMISERLKMRVLVLGGPGDRELVDVVVTKANSAGVLGKLAGYKELVTMLCSCKALICNNSGPLHLAASLSVPAVSTMGPTDPVLWRPVGPDNIVLRRGLECSPCSLGSCEYHKCLSDVSVDEMFDAVLRLLEKKEQ